MKGWFARRPAAAGIPDTLDDALPGAGRALPVAARACCCPARPVVTVVMPPAPGRPHRVDLLLCGHHYRVSQAAVRAAGAAVYDQYGSLLTAGPAGAATPRPAVPQPAALALRIADCQVNAVIAGPVPLEVPAQVTYGPGSGRRRGGTVGA